MIELTLSNDPSASSPKHHVQSFMKQNGLKWLVVVESRVISFEKLQKITWEMNIILFHLPKQKPDKKSELDEAY